MPSRIVNRPVQRVLKALLGLVVLLGAAPAAEAGDIANTVELTRRFGKFACETCIGETITEVEPGRTFMYGIYSAFDCGSCDGHTTTVVVEFPDSVIPRVEAYPAPYVQVVGSTVVIQQADHAGVFIVLQFSVKPEADLPAAATEIRMKTTITVVTPSDGTLQNVYEDVLPIVRDVGFTATAVATPDEVQLEDAAAAITVTVTFQNTGGDPLTHVAPTADPTSSGGGEVEKTAGPTPTSVDLAAGASAAITYTYKPTKGGKVNFFFEGFRGQGTSGPVDAGQVQSNEVTIKQDVEIFVTAEPTTLTTDSLATSGTLIRIKVTDKNGRPIAGQRVRLKFPQYTGLVDFNPRLLVCNSLAQLVFPPGDSPVLLDADIAPTMANGELTYQVWIGTQRRSTQLLVTAEAIDDSDSLLSSDGEFIDLVASGQNVPAGFNATLDTHQRSQQPFNYQPGGITGRGTPLQVLQSIIRWLEVEREFGTLADLRNVDFVPITSQDQANAGVLFYNRTQLQALIGRFAGTPTETVNGFVLPIEVRPSALVPDPFPLYEVKWATGMSLEQWEATKPLNRLGQEDPDRPKRDTAVPAIGLVTNSATAFLGYPYPAAGEAASGYGNGCLPGLTGVGVAQYSPVTLLVKNVEGQAVGFDPSGNYVNDIPGAVYSGGEPAMYLLPPGSYQADILGTDKGPATLILSAPGVTSTFTFKAKAGKTGTVSFDDTLASPIGTFDKKKLKVAGGVPITVTGVKKRVRVHSGDPLALTVTNPFGNPVAFARVHATGTDFDAETLTGADGVATMPLVVTKTTKRLTVTIDGAGVQPKTLKLKVKLLK